jgi:hypothetical protein
VRLFSVSGTELAMAAGEALVVNDRIFNLPRMRPRQGRGEGRAAAVANTPREALRALV